jgi:phospholipase/lecithinase/hemolysin
LLNVTGSSQFNPLVNPDTFLFWDDLHPTTRGHGILADAAINVLNAEKCRNNPGKGENAHCPVADALVH